jgi:hypothetical protein
LPLEPAVHPLQLRDPRRRTVIFHPPMLTTAGIVRGRCGDRIRCSATHPIDPIPACFDTRGGGGVRC